MLSDLRSKDVENHHKKADMSKYDLLWKYVKNRNEQLCKLSFEEIRNVLGFDIDHSFLNFKKELTEYGYSVEKISLKERTVLFVKET